MGEPRTPSRAKMREWPMFLAAEKRSHGRGSAETEGRPLPRIADLIMTHIAGTPSEKLAWLLQHKQAGKLDGDDPEEIAQAEALLAMLVRMSGAKGGRENWRHLDALLDEGLKETFPASDPVSVGHFTATEPPSRPIDTSVWDSTIEPKARGRRRPAPRQRVA